MQQVMQEVREVNKFKAMLAEWDEACTICRITGEEKMRHRLEVCLHKGSPGWVYITEGIKAVYKEMFTQQRFTWYSTCFKCGLL
jgi:hypothetical protein